MLSDINRTIEKIHNYIYANDGLDNYEVLEELLKIFYLKTYDEVNENLFEKSTSDSDILENITALFKKLTVEYPSLFEKVNIAYYTKTDFTENVEIFSLNKGITKIRVYMWIEGQDVDCENDASVGNISLNLQFSKNPN